MKVVGESGAWWIEGVPEFEVDGKMETRCGPYDTKREAEGVCRGLKKTLRGDWSPGEVSTDAEKRRKGNQ